jgi:glutamate transport system permease protein
VDVVFDNRDLFLTGMRTTVSLTLLSYAAALVVGTVVAAFRVSPVPPLRAFGAFYVGTVRNTPLAVLMVLFFDGLPDAGIIVDSRYISAIIVLSAYTSAFVAETVRAGVNTVAPGQGEAARSLGLTFPQVLLVVVLPQALRSVVAPLGSIFIALIKNSALAALISVKELSGATQELINSTAQPIPIFIGAAVAYLAIALPSGYLVSRLERRLAIKR